MARTNSDSSSSEYTERFLASLGTLDVDETSANNQCEIPSELRMLSAESRLALRRLAKYNPPPDDFPMRRRAAVMVALFASRHGHLNVLLTTRSSTMRTFASETALPGGKLEQNDPSLEYTARREAFEECGIPIDTNRVRTLTTLQPFLSRSNLIVTPIVCFIADQTITPNINLREVAHIFSHPLVAFLDSTPAPSLFSALTQMKRDPSTPYVKHWDSSWFAVCLYRMFRFESKASPIVGFTSDVLIEAAAVAYGRQPDFERFAPSQLPMREIIKRAVAKSEEFHQGTEADNRLGLDGTGGEKPETCGATTRSKL